MIAGADDVAASHYSGKRGRSTFSDDRQRFGGVVEVDIEQLQSAAGSALPIQILQGHEGSPINATGANQ